MQIFLYSYNIYNNLMINVEFYASIGGTKTRTIVQTSVILYK